MRPSDGRTTGGPDSLERRDYYFTTQVTLAGLLATAGERVNLHAGSVANDAGRVLVVVGPSGTGKTTATRALAAQLHYLSDETASITPDGLVFAAPEAALDRRRPRRRARSSSCRRTASGWAPPPITARSTASWCCTAADHRLTASAPSTRSAR